MATVDLPSPRWRKSSRSGSNSNCVEVAGLPASGVAVRDSKDRTGPVLVFSRQGWAAFVAALSAERV